MMLVNCLICRFVFYDTSQILQVRENQQQSYDHLSQPPFSTVYDLVVALSWGWELALKGVNLGTLKSFNFAWVSCLILAQWWLIKIWVSIEEASCSWNSSTWPLMVLEKVCLCTINVHQVMCLIFYAHKPHVILYSFHL